MSDEVMMTEHATHGAVEHGVSHTVAGIPTWMAMGALDLMRSGM